MHDSGPARLLSSSTATTPRSTSTALTHSTHRHVPRSKGAQVTVAKGPGAQKTLELEVFPIKLKLWLYVLLDVGRVVLGRAVWATGSEVWRVGKLYAALAPTVPHLYELHLLFIQPRNGDLLADPLVGSCEVGVLLLEGRIGFFGPGKILCRGRDGG